MRLRKVHTWWYSGCCARGCGCVCGCCACGCGCVCGCCACGFGCVCGCCACGCGCVCGCCACGCGCAGCGCGCGCGCCCCWSCCWSCCFEKKWIMCMDFNFINIWFYIQLHEQSRPRYYAVSATAQDSFQPILVRSRYARTTRPGITCTIQLVRQSQSINACSTITSLEMQVYQLSHK